MTDLAERRACRWCRNHNSLNAPSCERCGAPLDVRDVVTESGWRVAPRLRDLVEVACGSTRFQIDGQVVAAIEVGLAEGDSVFFEHDAMLWKDETVSMSVMDTPGGVKRLIANQPFVLSVAHGPGRISFSRDAPGQPVLLPLEPGREFQVRQHAMVVATAGLTYSYEKLPGLKATLATGSGMYLDRFAAQGGPGLLVLHGYGNVVERTLAGGETLEVEPGAFLYKEDTVSIGTVTHRLAPEGTSAPVQTAKGLASRGLAGLRAAKTLKKEGIGGILSGTALQQASAVLSGPGLTLMRLTGPGRIAIQSMYSGEAVN